MSRKHFALLCVLALVVGAARAEAQFTFSNYFEVRVGKDPDFDFLSPTITTPGSRLTRFDQFNLDYFSDHLLLGLRFEGYEASDDAAVQFNRFVHRYAEWNAPWLDARVGNFEQLFGRGVTLRAFSLPGIVREEFGTPQFGDSRDLDGVRLRFHMPRYEVVLLNGKPRTADQPPTADRNGSVTGISATVQPLTGIFVGGEYVRLDRPFQPSLDLPPATTELPGGFIEIGMDHWLRRLGIKRVSADTYIEYARATGVGLPEAASSPKLDANEGRALYVSQNLFLEDLLPQIRLGMSWEYKDYQNFEFQINEPPQLVREHSYLLLNRNTHVVDANQEEGYQFESVVQFRDLVNLTLNWSRAENRRSNRFEEFFGELAGRWQGARWSLFTGDSQDGSENLFDRKTWGTYGLVPVRGPHSLEVEYEQMTAFRLLGGTRFAFKDNYAALTWSWANRFSLTAVRQTTDDPVDAQDRLTGEISRRSYDSLSGSLRVGSHHELLAFWGRRRGGLQCTAGTCYVVRAFDGVSLQLISRF